jgi:hypothetical protein
MESSPAPPLKVSETEFAFHFLIIVFDAPMRLRGVDEDFDQPSGGGSRAGIWLLALASGHSTSNHSSGRGAPFQSRSSV